jgi:hypothetical protein
LRYHSGQSGLLAPPSTVVARGAPSISRSAPLMFYCVSPSSRIRQPDWPSRASLAESVRREACYRLSHRCIAAHPRDTLLPQKQLSDHTFCAVFRSALRCTAGCSRPSRLVPKVETLSHSLPHPLCKKQTTAGTLRPPNDLASPVRRSTEQGPLPFRLGLPTSLR